LETTIQIHRVVDDPDERARINGELNNKDVCTTTFVLREFLRTVIQDLSFVHSTAREAGAKDGKVALSKVARLLASKPLGFSARAAKRVQYVIAAILEQFEQQNVPLGKLLTFLEMTAQQWIEDFFEIRHGTGSYLKIPEDQCLNALDEPPDEMDRWLRDHYPIPPPPPFPNGASSFLQKKRQLVQAVEHAMLEATAKNRDLALLKILGRLRDANTKYDFAKLSARMRGNWALGDLLIALESPQDAHIYTTDRHYEVICRAIGTIRWKGYLPHKAATTEERES